MDLQVGAGFASRASRRATLRRMAALAALPSAATAAACGAGARGERPEAASAAPVTISLYSRTAEQEAFARRVPEFEAQYPAIKVDYNPLAGSYPEVIRTHAAAGTLAEVLYLQNLVFEGLAGGGDLQPVDALVKRDKLDLSQWYETGIKGFTLDGKLYGLPARGQIQDCYLYYNRDAFRRAGIREPDDRWTLDDLVAAAEKLTVRGEERYGYGTTWSTFARAIATFRRWGGDVLSPDGKKSLVDGPQTLQAMQWHWDLWHRRQIAIPKIAAPEDFGNGRIAVFGTTLAGQRSAVKAAVKDGFKWTRVVMPKGPTGTFGADTSIAPVSLNSKTKSVDQGWQLTKWLTNKDTGIALALQKTGSNTPGMRKDVYCDERVLNDPDYPREMLDRVCRSMDLAPTVPYSVPWNYRQPDLETVAARHMDAILQNTTTPSAASMRALHTELQAVLDQPRAGG